MDENVKSLKDWAIILHADQKYGSNDYSYHLDQVFELAIKYDLDRNTILAVYLHDCIEDCGLTKEKIAERTNGNVAEIVWAVSGFGKNRKERKQDIISKLQKYPQAINLKMIDRYANILQAKLNNEKLYKMYVDEMVDYKDIFSIGNPLIYKDLMDLIEMPLDEVSTKIKLGMK